MRRVSIWLLVLVAAAVIVYFLGPRSPADTTVRFEPASIGSDPEAWLAASEAKVPGIRPGQQKQIVWARPDHSKTPLAIVYVHGFSASSGEVRPLPDKVATELGANLFFTRLTGHGRDSAAMAEGSVNTWVNDYAEAMAIGRAIGEKVIVIATSTGGSAATLEAANPDVSRDVAGLVLISPNYGVQAAGSFLLTGPWATQLARLIVGPEYSFEPHNPRQAELWTTRYPSSALIPMGLLVKAAVATRVEDITIPALFVISAQDQVVRPDLTRGIAARWGAPNELVTVENAGDPSKHVIAGDALSPENTDPLAQRIVDWVRKLPAG